VDIVREFVATWRIAARVGARYRGGDLTWEQVQELVEDGEDSPLFRLKERCHALFRASDSEPGGASREVLFDLAVGALFHEAMKLRENFYQHAVYGPRIRALRRAARSDELTLFDEFEKLLGASSLRLDESLQETEALLEQTRRQLRRLLAADPGNGLVTRFLIEHAPAAQEAFGEPLDALLAEIHGSAGDGYLCAARSYLASGSFDLARGALDDAARRDVPDARLTALRAYAEGMSAYLEGRHGGAVERLALWVESDGADARRFADLAFAALSRIAEGEPCEARTHATELLPQVARLAGRTATELR
jgi:tetratricopeptide (TPR) repeat protein